MSEMSASALVLEVRANPGDLTALRALEASLATLLKSPGIAAMGKGAVTASAEYQKLQADLKKSEVAAAGLTAKLKQLDLQQKDTAASAGYLRSTLRGAGGASGSLWLTYAQDISHMAAMMGAFAVVATSIKGIKLSAEFEYATKYAYALASATGDASLSLEQLRAGLLGIKDTVHAPKELADAHKELVKAGFDAATALGGLAEMSRMATVAEEDLAAVSTVVVSQFRTWNAATVGAERGVTSLSQVMNAMTFAANESALGVKDLMTMVKHTAPIATLTGASFYEMLGALGYLTNAGVRGSTAATSLTTAMLKLQSQTGAATKMLLNLGVEFDTFDRKTGKMKSMEEVFKILGNAKAKLDAKEWAQLMHALFSQRGEKVAPLLAEGFSKMADDIHNGSNDLNKLIEGTKQAALEGTYLGKIYGDLSETAKVQALELNADIQRALTEAFNSEATTDLLKSLRELVNSGALNDLIGALGTTVRLAIELRGVAAELFQLWAASKIASLVWGLVTALEAATVAQMSLNGVMAANPIGIITLALYGTYKLGDAIWDHVNGLREADSKTRDLLKNTHSLGAALPTVRSAGGKMPGQGSRLQPGDSTDALDKKAFDSFVDYAGAAAKRREASLSQSNAAELKLYQSVLAAKLMSAEAFYKEESRLDEENFRAKMEVAQAEVAAKKQALGVAGEELRRTSELDTSANRDQAVASATKAAGQAQIAVLDAEAKVDLLRAAQEQKREQRENEAGFRRLATTRYEAKRSVEVGKEASAIRLAETSAALQAEQALWDQQRAEFRISETEHWDITRELKRKALQAGLADLEVQLDAERELLATAEKLQGEEIARQQEIDAHTSKIASLTSGYQLLVKELEQHNLLTRQARIDTKDWARGAEQALRSYADSASNVFASTESLMTNSFRNMEDALVEFVKTGKISFSDMIDSMISDLIRLTIQQSITGPLAGAAAGFIGNLLSPSATAGSTGSTVGGGSLYDSAISSGYMTSAVMHTGGTVGSAGTTRMAPASLFFNAPRFHNGLASDEFPAILQRGETVVPKGGGAVAAGGGVVVNLIESPGNGGKVERRQDNNGGNVLDVFVEQIKGAIAGDIARGDGAIPAAMGRTYGLNRVAGAY